MPTFRHGKNTAVFINGYDVSQYLNDITTSRQVTTAETTVYGQTVKTYISALRDGTLTAKGLWEGSTTGVSAIFEGLTQSSTDPVVTAAVEGATVGTTCHMTASIETQYQIQSPIANVNQLSASFQADGGLDSGKLLMANSVITAATTTNGTAVDNGAASSNGGFAHIHATNNTRTGATTVKIQHSTDSSTWVDLATFTNVAIATVSGQRITVASGTTVNRYLRAVVTTTGTGTITTSVAFARR